MSALLLSLAQERSYALHSNIAPTCTKMALQYNASWYAIDREIFASSIWRLKRLITCVDSADENGKLPKLYSWLSCLHDVPVGEKSVFKSWENNSKSV